MNSNTNPDRVATRGGSTPPPGAKNCRKAKNKIECRFTMPVVIIAGVGRGVYMPDSPHAVITKITRLSDGWIKVNYVNRKTYWKGKKITRRKV